MPQRHYQVGSSLGQALGGAFSDDAYNKGVNEGANVAYRRESALKAAEEARLVKRQNDLQSDDSILATALQGAGISSEDLPKFKNYMARGTISDPPKPQTGIDIQSVLGGALKNSATVGEDYSAFIEPKQVVAEPDMMPQQRQQYDLAMRSIASMRQALMQGDKSTTNATETALANMRASGAGNNDTTLAQLLLHGKPQFDGQTTGSTDVLTGNQVLNDIGRSQITENIAQAGNANASARKTAREVAKAPSDEYKAVRDDIRADYNAEYPIDRYTGQRPKGAVSYDDYTKGWIKKHGIDEKNFFNAGNPIVTPAETQMAPEPFAPPAQRFSNDPSMKGNKAGKMVDGKGIEVFNASGKLIGYYK